MISRYLITALIISGMIGINGITGLNEAHAGITAYDFEGQYLLSGSSLVAGGAGAGGVMTVTVGGTKEDGTVDMAVENFYGIEKLDACFDPLTERMVIPNQFLYTDEIYNNEVWFENFSVRNGRAEDKQEYIVVRNSECPFYFEILDNGNLKAGAVDRNKWINHEYTDAELLETVCIAAAIMPEKWELDNSGEYFMLTMWVEAERAEEFTFVQDEWQLLGNAAFTDAWFAFLWDNEQAPTYDVPVYYNKANAVEYLLYDPFGKVTPYADINISDAPGYLIFEIADPGCVIFRPMIYAMTAGNDDDTEGAGVETVTQFYCFNREGLLLFEFDYSSEEIMATLGREGRTPSTFDAECGEVRIENAVYSCSINPIPFYESGKGSIRLPDNWTDGVENILGQNAAPTEYYNLQGVRLHNPEPGRIVIVRQGGSSKKVML